MQVHQHARPHIETHTRSRGHSSVAGAAYRLGLKLLDERSGTWHDYSRRSTKGEIVLALTVAPEGAPEWATRPQELWSRAENAERRKDSQVARDFRCPVPLGFPSEQACALAQQMAEFIADTFKTPVSVGVHRDSTIDVLGKEKVVEKTGYHVHLYFPTRRLACFDDGKSVGGAGADGVIGDEVAGCGFGSKLTVLSNKRTAAAAVEMLNAKWAETCNELCIEAGLSADYDHRSYARQGVDLSPQPTVGQTATALERRGIETHRGNLLRAALEPAPGDTFRQVGPPGLLMEAEASGLVPELAVGEGPGAGKGGPSTLQVDQASSSVGIEPPHASSSPDFSGFSPGGNVVFLDQLRQRRQSQGFQEGRSSGGQGGAARVVALPVKHRPNTSTPSVNAPKSADDGVSGGAIKSWLRQVEKKPSLEVLARRHQLVVAKSSSVVSGLEKVLPQPFTTSEKERFKEGLTLIGCLEKILATLEAAQDDEAKKAKAYELAKAAALDVDYLTDQARAGRKVAKKRLELWLHNRPKPHRLFGYVGPGKRKHEELQEMVRWKDELVQSAKRTSERLHAFSQEALRALLRVQALLIELRRELAVTAVDLRSRHFRMLEELLRWLSIRQQKMLNEAMPGPTEFGLEAGARADSGADAGAGGGTQKGVPPVSKPVSKLAPGRR